MLNFNSLMLGSSDPKTLIAFYKKVLAKNPEWEEENWVGFTIGNGFLSIGPHSDVKGENKEPGRLIFNFETNDVKGEFKRIKELDAAVIKEPYEMEGMWIATFTDPDGNYFQLMSPMK